MSVRYRVQLNGGYTVDDGAGLVASARYGDTGMPSSLDDYTDGTGTGQADQIYRVNFSLAATTGASYDLKGGGGEIDVIKAALAMVQVRKVEIYISTTQASGVTVRFGPQNTANAWQGPFQDVTANFYVEVGRDLKISSPFAGTWTVGATTKILRLYNPNAATVAGVMIVTGRK